MKIKPVPLSYAIFTTDAGWMGVLASAKGLVSLTFPQVEPEACRQLLGLRTTPAVEESDHFPDLIKRLRAYFNGAVVRFDDKLDLSRGTDFQREVWQHTRLIPYGETRSYSWLAEAIGRPRASRSVGHALSLNPLPLIIPCHRVVGISGRLCGFRGGLDMKSQLISLENGPRRARQPTLGR